MPRGASPQREREYQQIEAKFEQEGRYRGREKEVAARIVNKQRKEAGETSQASSAGDSLPIRNYQQLTVPEVRSALAGLTAAQRSKVRRYETAHKNRKGVLQALNRSH